MCAMAITYSKYVFGVLSAIVISTQWLCMFSARSIQAEFPEILGRKSNGTFTVIDSAEISELLGASF